MTYEKGLAYGEELCGRAEYSSGEVMMRLVRRGASGDVARSVVENLRSRRFIDDGRFARAYVREKAEYSRWGRQKITAMLIEKRVGRADIDEALDEIDPEVFIGSAVHVMNGKLRSLRVDIQNIDYQSKIKLIRFAAGRGFTSAEISEAISRMEKGENND